MSFSAIIDDLRSQVAAELALSGDTWNRLAYIYEVDKNDFRSNFRGYGVRSLGAIEQDLIARQIDVLHSFEVLLVKDIVERSSDELVQDDIKELQDRSEEIYKKLLYTQIGGKARQVNNLELAEPEINIENNIVVQRFTFDVRYRIKL